MTFSQFLDITDDCTIDFNILLDNINIRNFLKENKNKTNPNEKQQLLNLINKEF